MELNATWVAAIASAASAAIVAISAVAAFVQVRHIRNSNEITVFLKLVERLDSLEAEAAFAGMTTFLERVEQEPALRYELSQEPIVADFRPIASLLQFLEHLSTLIVTGHMTDALVLAEYADNIERLWDRLAGIIFLRRIARGPFVCAAFEHLAMRAKRYIADGTMDRLYGRLLKDPRMASFVAPHAPDASAAEEA